MVLAHLWRAFIVLSEICGSRSHKILSRRHAPSRSQCRWHKVAHRRPDFSLLRARVGTGLGAAVRLLEGGGEFGHGRLGLVDADPVFLNAGRRVGSAVLTV